MRVSCERPVISAGRYAAHLWVERPGRTGLNHGFRICDADGTGTHAHGHRVLVRVDAGTLRPTPWSDRARAIAADPLGRSLRTRRRARRRTLPDSPRPGPLQVAGHGCRTPGRGAGRDPQRPCAHYQAEGQRRDQHEGDGQ